ncbi:OstA-like protein [Flavobacteriaceae bacterium MAR_2010_188]|nr:OstA-like protein [Flavobacteriaceae bacterium MAR_2010_188]
MIIKNINLLFTILIFPFAVNQSFGQQPKKIDIEYSGVTFKDSITGENVLNLLRDNSQQIHVIHEGIDLYCDKALYYIKEDFIEAFSNVKMNQGDSITMNADYLEYSGATKLAIAKGNVLLNEPQSRLTTDTLYFDRVKQQAYYRTGGEVVRDTSGTITSKIGRYYMETSKYQFVNDVKLVNPDYVIDTQQLDFYTEPGHAYLFGPTTITSDASTIYCERGFYDTNNDTGYFVKNSKIDYESRRMEGDSMYFDRKRSFASATNNIKVTDTVNNSVIKGHYAEVFRERDSVFITKRALAITVQENDSLYIHSDTLMVTGKPEHRITRAFYNAKIYKSDLSGKADSIHADHKSGLTQLINLLRYSSTDAFAEKRNPVLWNMGNQMTGDSIHLISNVEKEELDSLKVFDNAFLISKDTLGSGFNQVKGLKLFGLFENNKLRTVDIIKNAEVIYYNRNEVGELQFINKSQSGSININIFEDEIETLTLINQVDGKMYPESQFPENADKFRGFVWREEEQPKSVEDLFSDDPPLNLPVIKGLEEYVPQEEFFDEGLMTRIEKTEPATKTFNKKAGRSLPNEARENQRKRDSIIKAATMKNPVIKKKKDN